MRIVEGLPSLRRIEWLPHFLECFYQAREREGFRLCHFSIQANHIHVIVEADDPDHLARGMRSLSGRLAKCLNRLIGTRQRVFGDRFHSHVLTSPYEVRNAVRYVLCNARKHGLEYGIDRPDNYSSGLWFEEWAEPHEPRLDVGPPPVARPRTWLLSRGWLRHGRIPLAARPMN